MGKIRVQTAPTVDPCGWFLAIFEARLILTILAYYNKADGGPLSTARTLVQTGRAVMRVSTYPGTIYYRSDAGASISRKSPLRYTRVARQKSV